jgi:hypothetical protein
MFLTYATLKAFKTVLGQSPIEMAIHVLITSRKIQCAIHFCTAHCTFLLATCTHIQESETVIVMNLMSRYSYSPNVIQVRLADTSKVLSVPSTQQIEQSMTLLHDYVYW